MAENKEHVFISGASSSGKSTLARYFRGRGKNAHDIGELGIGRFVDLEGRVIPRPTGERWQRADDFKWIWDRERLMEVLSENKGHELYLFGGIKDLYLKDNKTGLFLLDSGKSIFEFLHLFDRSYYLDIPEEVIKQRVKQRAGEGVDHDYGNSEAQLASILNNLKPKAEGARNAGFILIDGSLSREKLFDTICNKAEVRRKLKV